MVLTISNYETIMKGVVSFNTKGGIGFLITLLSQGLIYLDCHKAKQELCEWFHHDPKHSTQSHDCILVDVSEAITWSV